MYDGIIFNETQWAFYTSEKQVYKKVNCSFVFNLNDFINGKGMFCKFLFMSVRYMLMRCYMCKSSAI